MSKRVVVTGLGAVTPIGNDVASFWESIQAGRSGIGRNTKFDVSEYPSKIAGIVKDFDPTTFIEKKEESLLTPLGGLPIFRARCTGKGPQSTSPGDEMGRKENSFFLFLPGHWLQWFYPL